MDVLRAVVIHISPSISQAVAVKILVLCLHEVVVFAVLAVLCP